MEPHKVEDIEFIIKSLSKLVKLCEVYSADQQDNYLRRESRNLLLNISLWLSYQNNDYREILKSGIVYQIENLTQYMTVHALMPAVSYNQPEINAEVLLILQTVKEFVEKK